MGEETTYQYDGNGNLIQKIDPKGQKTEYSYDAAGRLVEIRYYNPVDPVNPVKTVSFTYDSVGNLTGYDDGITSATYVYDNNYRKILEEIDYGPFTKTYSYTYYANGLKKTFTNANGTTYTYTYDANNQLKGVQIPNIGFVTIGEYTWNRPASITLPGGSKRDYTYDPLMQVKGIAAKDPAQNTIMTRDYAYSPAGNITGKETEHGNYTYQYDDLYRLTNVLNPAGVNEEYSYDGVGNRLTSAVTTGNWTYNQNNELLGYDDVSYGYDENGNTTRKTVGAGEENYIYDIENRLIRVEDGQGYAIADYYYDPFGRRLWKEVDGTRTYFLYSDEGLIGEYDLSGNEIKAYGWRPDSTWSTNPLFVKIAGVYYWYQNDHPGTPQKIIGTNGLVVWAGIYDSFGNCQVEIEGIENNLRFPGQYFDTETGLHYNWSRYYDPSVGRYLTTDPLGDSINLYAYVNNSPILWIDPWGLCLAKDAWGKFKFLSSQGFDYLWNDLFFQFSDFSAGFGDVISFGATRDIRGMWNEAYGWQDSVDYGSINYSIGEYSGYAWFIGSGIGTIEAGAIGTIRAAGTAAWMYTKPRVIGASVFAANKVLSNPRLAHNVSDFAQGLIPSTPPPASFAGLLGLETGLLFEKVMKR